MASESHAQPHGAASAMGGIMGAVWLLDTMPPMNW
jgi:hypothetical protein